MTGSFRYLAREISDNRSSDASVRAHNSGNVLAINLGSRQLTRDEELRYHAAAFLAHRGMLSEEATNPEAPESEDFEAQRTAWMLAKDIAALIEECGGDLVQYVEDTGADAAIKSKVAAFIPAALEAHWLKESSVG